jgi:hypothetical protein
VTSTSLAPLAILALLVVGCGKTDSALIVVREDPRTGPIRLLPPPDEGPLPAAIPRWDPPTEANGFSPVPLVERHP